MCGICGIVDSAGRPVAEAVAWRMARAIEHRGHDATGVAMWPRHTPAAPGEPTVAFGHNRLKIIDLSDAANQPLDN